MRTSSHDRGEEGRERVTPAPKNVDDLWHFSYVLKSGDLIFGDTTRRIQCDDEQMRDIGGEREHFNVATGTDDVEFVHSANRLHVGGVIVSCSREDQLGHHHTLNVEGRAEMTIEKQFKTGQVDRIETAEQAVENPGVTIATVEKGAAYIRTVAQYDTEEYASIMNPTRRDEYVRPRPELFDELGSALLHLEVDAIILAGPGFTRNDTMDCFEDDFPAVVETTAMTVDATGADGRGVHGVLKRNAVDDVQKQTRIAEEASLIGELMGNISTNAKAVYGVEQVVEAAEFSAVEHLLLLDSQLRAERQGGGDWGVNVSDTIDSVEQKGGEVTVFFAEFQPGEQLKNLGDVAVVFRYRLQQSHAGEAVQPSETHV